MIRVLLVAAMLLPLPAAAQEPTRAKEAADRFSLDLPQPAEDAEATPGEPAAAPEPAADAPMEVDAGGVSARLTLDTPIETLLANRRAKAVLDRDMPGLSSDKNLDRFNKLSLRSLAPMSGGRLTPALLDKVAADLAAIR